MAEAKKHDKLIETAKKRFQLASDAESEIRRQYLEDLRFRAGEQWPEGIKRQREMDGRPCLTINQMPAFCKRITNEQRQNRPAIKVDPVGNGADQETAEIEQGMIRHIEYDSDAESAYDTASECAVVGGFGFIRLVTEYDDPLSFEQVIKIKRVRNPLQVYLDPFAKEPDRSDANWGFCFEAMSKEQFKKDYPNAEASTMADWTSDGDGWFQEDECRIAEYYYRESVNKTIVQLVNGVVMDKAIFDKNGLDESLIAKKRETQVFAIKWVKMNGLEVLEETDIPGRWIPIIPVLGDELDVDGKIILEGVVRHAKDPQQQYNFMATATTETIALAPRAPFIGVEGQFEGHEDAWKAANVKNMPYLQYKNVAVNGGSAPPPQRQAFEPAIQATTMAMMQASQDLKSVTGIYEAALGAPSNEISGTAIKARQQQTQGSNFNYQDNLKRALRHVGRIMVSWIPYIYDTARIQRIIGTDGSRKLVAINTQPGPQQGDVAIERLYDVTVGKYDVVIDTGPSYQTQRQEAADTQLQLMKAFPPVMQAASDIIVANMDIPGAQEISERLKLMLPPQLQKDQKQGDMPPQAQQAIAQLTQQNQQLTQHLNATQDDLDKQVSAKQMELESKERIAFAQVDIDRQRVELEYEKLRVSMVNADIAAKAANAETAFEAEMEALGQAKAHSHEYAMAQVGHEQAQEMQAQQPQDSAQPTAQQQ